MRRTVDLHAAIPCGNAFFALQTQRLPLLVLTMKADPLIAFHLRRKHFLLSLKCINLISLTFPTHADDVSRSLHTFTSTSSNLLLSHVPLRAVYNFRFRTFSVPVGKFFVFNCAPHRGRVPLERMERRQAYPVDGTNRLAV